MIILIMLSKMIKIKEFEKPNSVPGFSELFTFGLIFCIVLKFLRKNSFVLLDRKKSFASINSNLKLFLKKKFLF